MQTKTAREKTEVCEKPDKKNLSGFLVVDFLRKNIIIICFALFLGFEVFEYFRYGDNLMVNVFSTGDIYHLGRL